MSTMIKKVFEETRYSVKVWGRFSEEKYKFGIQAIPLRKQPKTFSGWVSIEFIEDNIDNGKNLDYLEKIVVAIADRHFEEIMQAIPRSVASNIQWWFKEAHEELRKNEII